MKRPLQLPLAIALALGGTNALALGLGAVQVKSRLNQPLEAEIPVIQGNAGEAEGLLVSLASAEDFERVGMSRSRLNVPLEFSIVKGKNGQTVIKVTSKDPVRDSFLDFLVEANWPNGRMLREYTVLLDPPSTAPSRRTATTSAPAATTRPLQETRRAPVAAAPASVPVPAAPRVAAAPAARKVSNGEYGPVEAGETLSAIARNTRPDDSTNVNQMMLALLKSNPGAFYKDNVNALKRGAILRIPSADEIRATGSAREAAAEIHAQIEDWRGGTATPTRIADAGSRSAPIPGAPPAVKSSSTSPGNGLSDGERLELVPPKAGKDSLAMADQPGSGNSTASATRELKSELARTKETLATRSQETGELKSRVDELEDLKAKNERLINLKNSEIAELQQKLKELREQDKTAAKAPTVAVVAPPPVVAATDTVTPPTNNVGDAVANEKTLPGDVKPAPSIDKADIWGEAGSGADAKPDAATKPVTATSAAAVTEPSSKAPDDASSPAAVVAEPVKPDSAAVVMPLPESPPAGSQVAATAPKAKPAAPVTKAKPRSVSVAAPWYDAPWVKPAALGAGVLLVLLGLLGMRKRKAVPSTPRGSIADSFGNSPLEGTGTGSALDDEVVSLREQISHDPDNVGLHLELLSIFYAERDVASFEDAAADMYGHVTDPHQPEWLEAQAMGQELAPHNPLFAGAEAYDDADDGDAYADTGEVPVVDEALLDDGEYRFGESTAAEPFPSLSDSDPLPPPGVDDSGYGFEGLPPLEPDVEEVVEIAPAVPEPGPLDEDYFPGEDAIGTKLDLAKAYMDMGDPEGARSMLEEVVAEGSESQKAEAHRLIAELG